MNSRTTVILLSVLLISTCLTSSPRPHRLRDILRDKVKTLFEDVLDTVSSTAESLEERFHSFKMPELSDINDSPPLQDIAFISEDELDTENHEFTNHYVLDNTTYSKGIYTLCVRYVGNDSYYIKETSPIVKQLVVTISIFSEQEFSIKIRDASQERWEVPERPPFASDEKRHAWVLPIYDYRVVYYVTPFALKVVRRQTNEVIFDTSMATFIYSDKYLEFTTLLPSDHLYGLGERAYKFSYSDGEFTIFNKDQPTTLEQEKVGNSLYGTHPVWLFRENQSKAFNMVLLRTTNGLDFVVGKNEQKQRTLTFKIIGGIIDLRFFLGDKSPETSMKLYHRYLGDWLMPPFWALGFHQCRWGYRSLDDLKNVYQNYTNNNLPLDVMWSDIDYMVDYQDFTIDTQRYPLGELKQFMNDVGLRFVPIIDAGIAVGDNMAYNEGIKRKVFIQSSEHPGQPLWGIVWPGRVHYVDFLHPNSTGYWEDMLGTLYDNVEFDGLWVDMNEASNFCDGECPPSALEEEHHERYSRDYYHKKPAIKSPHSPDLPYDIGGAPLDQKTLSPSAIHWGGHHRTEYNLHSTFGYLETIATHNYLRNRLNQRLPFIVSRSTLWGHGRYGTHWTGDNLSDWPFLRVSIPHLFSFGLFGVPMIGADICGFAGNTNPELCARWMQLGTLYPFARNHNINDSIPQEPYSLGDMVLETSKNSLKFRYSMLKYYYMLFISLRGAGSIFKPLFFEFPDDEPAVYTEKVMNEQILLGSDLMFTPIVYQGVEEITPYFPEGAWFNLHTGVVIQSSKENASRRKVTNRLPDVVPAFIREGAIVHLQNTTIVLKSSDLTENFTLIAAVKKMEGNRLGAFGKIMGIKNYLDQDEVVEKCIDRNCVININITNDPIKPSEFYVHFTPEDPEFREMTGVLIEKITFYGAWSFTTRTTGGRPKIFLKGVSGPEQKIVVTGHKFNRITGVLEIDTEGIRVSPFTYLVISL